MKNKQLSDKPKNVLVEKESNSIEDASSWFYEEDFGLYIVVRLPIDEKTVKYVHLKISWRSILSPVGRYLKGKKK